jgi:sterol 3beta-glucosyltransferase
MVTRDVHETITLVLEALSRVGRRGVLARGWGGLRAEVPASAHVFWLDSAPHDWLFPRMAAVVHHGGAGTTAAGLRSGVPSIVVPHAFDQPFWGHRVAELGAGPPPIPRRILTAQRLAGALATAIQSQTMRERAAAVGAQIRDEHGVAEAINHIHRVIVAG